MRKIVRLWVQIQTMVAAVAGAEVSLICDGIGWNGWEDEIDERPAIS